MKRFLHIAMLLVILMTLPCEANCQNRLSKIIESITHVPRVQTAIGIKIPSVGPGSIAYAVKKVEVTPPIISGITPFSAPEILIDTTIFTQLNQRYRISQIIEMSRERVDISRNEWLSLHSSKDRSFAYEEYKFEKSRLQMLVKISLNPEFIQSPEKALEQMEAIYNREVIVLPSVEINIPKLVQ